MNTRGKTLEGSCRTPHGQKQLACVPDRNHRTDTDSRRSSRREHTITQSNGLPEIITADQHTTEANRVTIKIEGRNRIIQSNGIPNHKTGRFPNSGNPNALIPQKYRFRIPAFPEFNHTTTELGMNNFGIALNGIPFDPGAAEWYLGKRGSQWQYEPLSGAIKLGIDGNFAHVQPTGAYHYHGIPYLLLSQLGGSEDQHSPLVGWAADGFPIYALYGHQGELDVHSNIVPVTSSYQLRKGPRPSYGDNPGGVYDGTFTADYEYIPFSGMLDECNGKQTVTPEFPGGTYAYFLTENWPVIPRCFKGKPSEDFRKGR